MNPKKVLLIIPEMSLGGAQRSISKLSTEIALHHRVWLVVFNSKDPVAYEHGGELKSLGIESGPGLLQKLIAFRRRVVRLRRLKRSLKIDVSISFLEGADYINVLSKLNDKIVLGIRGSKFHDETMSGRFRWLRNSILIPWLYAKADVLVTVNGGIARELKTYHRLRKSNILTISNFYNLESIAKLSCEPKGKYVTRLYDDPVLVTTGRLAPEKGLTRLLHVFHGLKMKLPNLRLIMVGEGPQQEELVSTCRSLNLDVCVGEDFEEPPDVLMLGHRSNVFLFLRGATLYLMNSSSEGFPNGLVEAMICGVPVVSSDCPYGPREILAPEFPFNSSVSEPYYSPNGLLMPIIKTTEDIDRWIAAIHDLLRSKEKLARIAENGLLRITHFDDRQVMTAWNKILEN